MKTLTIALLAATMSVPAWASTPSSGTNLLAADGSGQTPYQILESLFNKAQPMQLDQMPTLKTYQSWLCSSAATQSTPISLMGSDSSIPTLLEGKSIASPSYPGAGPLFPASPQREQTLEVIGYMQADGTLWAGNGSLDPSEENVGTFSAQFNIELHTSPELTQSLVYGGGEQTVTYRTVNGLIVVRDNTDTLPGDTTYSYCWKK